jgi:hypothetical protein
MYQYIEEKNLFDKWAQWCERENAVHKHLGVNLLGFPKRNPLDRIGEAGEAPGPVRYTDEHVSPDHAHFELISSLMSKWERQLPTVHRCLMVRHRGMLPERRVGFDHVYLSVQDKAFLALGDGSLDGVALFYALCEGGYRLLRIQLGVNEVRQLAWAA